MLHTFIKTAVSVSLLASATITFAGNLNVSKEITVNASPETTWKLIGDFNHLDVWHPVVVGSNLTQGNSQSAGAVRILTLGNGATITEELLSTNNAKKSYSYVIIESPLPIADYESTITVAAADDGKSTVIWSSTFDADGASDEEAVNTITGIYDAGLNNLDKYFNK